MGPQHSRTLEQLQTLDKPQLLALLASVMAVHPESQRSVAALMPRPSVESVASILSTHEANLRAAFPYSKMGLDFTDYCFNRVRPHIEQLRDTILHYLDHFTLPESYPPSLAHEYPASAFAFLHLVTTIAHRLPTWQSDAHNAETRVALYDRLGKHWRIAIAEVARRARSEGKVFGAMAVGEWIRNLYQHTSQVKNAYGFVEAFDELKRHLGWVVGLAPDDSPGSCARNHAILPLEMAGLSGFGPVTGSAF